MDQPAYQTCRIRIKMLQFFFNRIVTVYLSQQFFTANYSPVSCNNACLMINLSDSFNCLVNFFLRYFLGVAEYNTFGVSDLVLIKIAEIQGLFS